MKKVVLVFGLISGAISSAMMFLTLPFIKNGSLKNGEIIGYTAIFLSFLLVFFGIRSYRENAGGTITFGRHGGRPADHPDLVRVLCGVVGDHLLQGDA